MWLDPAGKKAPYLSGRVQEYTAPTLPNKKYIMIFDMNLHSSVHRFHIINIETGEVESMTAAHGQDTDCGGKRFGYACRFANNTTVDEASPLGFFATGPEFKPSGPLKHNYGIFLYGLEKNSGSFEGNDLPDAIVMHDANYVNSTHAGRSHGCIALSENEMEDWKDKIKDGALVYFYHDAIEKMRKTPAVSGIIRAGN
jgi:hypothetical protein